MFIRPQIQEFPEYKELPKLNYEDDFHYSRGREDVASSNFGDVLKVGGMVAGAASGIGALGAAGIFGTGGLAGTGSFLATSGIKTLGTIGTGLTNLSNSFYPQQGR